MSDGPPRSPSGTWAALGVSANDILGIVHRVAQIAAAEIFQHPDRDAATQGGFIAQGVRNELATAYLSVRDNGRAEGREELRAECDALAAGIGAALAALAAGDVATAELALRRAAMALPVADFQP